VFCILNSNSYFVNASYRSVQLTCFVLPCIDETFDITLGMIHCRLVWFLDGTPVHCTEWVIVSWLGGVFSIAEKHMCWSRRSRRRWYRVPNCNVEMRKPATLWQSIQEARTGGCSWYMANTWRAATGINRCVDMYATCRCKGVVSLCSCTFSRYSSVNKRIHLRA
jgi:hypothetical protein